MHYSVYAKFNNIMSNENVWIASKREPEPELEQQPEQKEKESQSWKRRRAKAEREGKVCVFMQ